MTSLYNQDQYAKHARLQTRTVKLHALFQTMPNTLTYKASISKYSPHPPPTFKSTLMDTLLAKTFLQIIQI